MKMYEKKKKAVVPRLRFPEFLDAGEWAVKRLGIIAKVIRGSSPRPISQFLTKEDDGFNWLKIGDISNESKYVYSTEQKIEKSGASKTREVYPGDLILSNSMSFGRPYIMGIRACIHDGWLALTDLKYGLSSEFLYYFMLSDHSQRRLHDAAAGGGVRNLNVDIVKFLSIATPISSKEQQKIADCLASLDDLIRAGEAQLVALKDHKKGLMQQLFPREGFPREGETTTRLRFPEFRDAGEWEVRRLGEVADVYQPETISQSNLSKNGKYLVYGANGIIGRFDSYNHENSQIAITCRGSTCGEVTLTEPQSWITGNSMVVNLDKHQEVKKLFLYQQFVITDCKYLITGSGQPQITGEIKNHKVVLPSLQEQQKIADCLASLDDLIRTGEAQLVALKDHKKGLMQQLFPQEVG